MKPIEQIVEQKEFILQKDDITNADLDYLAKLWIAEQAYNDIGHDAPRSLRLSVDNEFTRLLTSKGFGKVIDTLASYFDDLQVIDPRTYRCIMNMLYNL